MSGKKELCFCIYDEVIDKFVRCETCTEKMVHNARLLELKTKNALATYELLPSVVETLEDQLNDWIKSDTGNSYQIMKFRELIFKLKGLL